ncbi:DUF4097 family beta strand repeat-containing protein [Lacticaseibacillus pantheris]|nr:DUF4097 family beta strand repeat-containing protein [Lacticaseibacillus pantheris]
MKGKLMITGLIVATVGALMMAVGLTNQAETNMTWADGLRTFSTTERNVSLGRVDRLVVNTSDYDVTVRRGNDRQVHVQGPSNRPVTVKQSGGTVRIASHVRGWIQLGIGTMTEHITVTLPANTHLSALTANLGDGNLDLDVPMTVASTTIALDDGRLTTKEFTTQSGRITLNDGGANLTDTKLRNTSLQSDDGGVTVTNSTLTGGRYHTDDGRMEFTNTRFRNVVSVRAEDGSITMASPQTDGYVLSAEDGGVSLFGKHNESSITHKAEAANRVEAHASDGHVTVK